MVWAVASIDSAALKANMDAKLLLASRDTSSGRANMVAGVVQLYVAFRSRKSGSFGSSISGNILEFCTKTWARFTCVLMFAFIALPVLFSNLPSGQKLSIVAAAPIAALIYWYAFLLLLLLCRYMGPFGIIFANLLLIYFYLFSRLIVQPPPGVYLPLTRGGARL